MTGNADSYLAPGTATVTPTLVIAPVAVLVSVSSTTTSTDRAAVGDERELGHAQDATRQTVRQLVALSAVSR